MELTGKAWVPTDEDLRVIRTFASFGIPYTAIAAEVKVNEITLVKHCGQMMEQARAQANARVAHTLYQLAVTDKNLGAVIFWLKTRAGWRETTHVELDSRNLNVNINAPQDPAQLAQAVRILIESGALKAEDIMPQLASRNGHASA